MNRLELLENLKDECCNNILCYSDSYLISKPKDTYIKEWKKEKEKLRFIESLINDENTKIEHKEKNKRKDKYSRF